MLNEGATEFGFEIPHTVRHSGFSGTHHIIAGAVGFERQLNAGKSSQDRRILVFKFRIESAFKPLIDGTFIGYYHAAADHFVVMLYQQELGDILTEG